MSTGKAKLRGATLLELIICCGLLGLLLSSLAVLVVYGSGYLQFAETQVDVQGEMLRALRHLASDVGETAASTVSVSPNAISFASPRRADGVTFSDSNGQTIWASFLRYSLVDKEGVSCLVRQARALPTPSSSVPLPAGFEPTAGDWNGLPQSVFGHNIVELECYRADLHPDFLTMTPAEQARFRHQLRSRLTSRVSHYRKVHVLRVSSSTFMRQ